MLARFFIRVFIVAPVLGAGLGVAFGVVVFDWSATYVGFIYGVIVGWGCGLMFFWPTRQASLARILLFLGGGAVFFGAIAFIISDDFMTWLAAPFVGVVTGCVLLNAIRIRNELSLAGDRPAPSQAIDKV